MKYSWLVIIFLIFNQNIYSQINTDGSVGFYGGCSNAPSGPKGISTGGNDPVGIDINKPEHGDPVGPVGVSGPPGIPFETKHAERTYTYSNRFFVVCYDYCTDYYMIPATLPPGEPHYSATITVYEVIKGEKIKVCEPFSGQYIEKGCFEDAPESLVQQALKIKEQEIYDKLHPKPPPEPTYQEKWEKDMGKKWPYIKNDPPQDTNNLYVMSFGGLSSSLYQWNPNKGRIIDTQLKDGKLIITKRGYDETHLRATYYSNCPICGKNPSEGKEDLVWKEVYGTKGTNIVLESFIRGHYIPEEIKKEQIKFGE